MLDDTIFLLSRHAFGCPLCLDKSRTQHRSIRHLQCNADARPARPPWLVAFVQHAATVRSSALYRLERNDENVRAESPADEENNTAHNVLNKLH